MVIFEIALKVPFFRRILKDFIIKLLLQKLSREIAFSKNIDEEIISYVEGTVYMLEVTLLITSGDFAVKSFKSELTDFTVKTFKRISLSKHLPKVIISLVEDRCVFGWCKKSNLNAITELVRKGSALNLHDS